MKTLLFSVFIFLLSSVNVIAHSTGPELYEAAKKHSVFVKLYKISISELGIEERSLGGGGSGVVVAEHYVVTMAHVAESLYDKPLGFEIELQDVFGNNSNGRVVSYNTEHDLALIYTEAKLNPATIRKKPPYLGEDIFFIGTPWIGGQPFKWTLTFGHVSHLARDFSKNSVLEIHIPLIQGDIEGFPGMSGGGAWNMAGELIGWLSMVNANNLGINGGISFIVPVPAVCDLIKKKIEPEPDVDDDFNDESEDTAEEERYINIIDLDICRGQ